MNKYAILGLLLVAIVGGGIVFSRISDTDNCTEGMGKDVVLNVVSKKLEWRFEPESIEVEKCDRVKMTVTNEDDFDHGVAIDAFGISQRLPALGQITVEFVASKTGEVLSHAAQAKTVHSTYLMEKSQPARTWE
jgi:plastocyanin